MQTTSITCSNCGASLKMIPQSAVMKCEYCDSLIPVPREFLENVKQLNVENTNQQTRINVANNNKQGLPVFKAHKRFWMLTMGIYLGISCVLSFMGDDLHNEILESIAIVGLIFSLVYTFSGRPRASLYKDYEKMEHLKKVAARASIWRILLLLWCLAMNILWGLPAEHAMYNTFFDVGLFVFIAGLIILIRFRPSKYRFTLIKEDKGYFA